MKLSKLVEHIEYELVQGSLDTEVADIAYDSRKMKEGMLFVAIAGTVVDGHKYIPDVVKKGASVLVVEKEIESIDESITVIRVANGRAALSLLSQAYFDYPASKMISIGITGTKGKSTTTYMIRDIIEKSGKTCGIVGTIGVAIAGKVTPTEHTTPESYDLQRYFKDMVDAGCEYMVMEVSSQGIKMDRVAGMHFNYGIFTNITPDHIGPNEHASFEEYAACKGMLFRQCRLGIANIDDEHFHMVLDGHTCELETIGFSEAADYRASNMELIGRPGYLGVKYHVSGKLDMDVEIDIPGRFSVYNSLVAIAVCEHFKVSEDDLKAALRVVKTKGRIELVKVSDDFILMIDYAHNAMALESLLSTLREDHPKRLVCVFGCGGNRSKLRRYEMGEVSGKLADLTVITSDNPRFEEPQDIINDIKIGMEKTDGKYIEICDRKEAIRYVIEHGEKGDVIVLAGKGHEDYQEIKGVKYPMDERVLIQEVLKELSEK